MSKSSKPPKDPEGRMSLGDHLRELRTRVVKSVLAIVACTIVAAIYHRRLEDFLLAPLPTCPTGPTTAEAAAQIAKLHGKCAQISTIGVVTPFSLALRVSLLAGIVASVPIWLYQLWAFVAPGLHKHERRYSLAFMAAGAPLFLAGVTCAYLVLPTTVTMLLSFSPNNTTPILPPEMYFNMATRLVLLFGLAFELPLLLVMLNFVGILSGKRMLGWWRGMLMGITVFAAFAAPSPDPVSMLALAAPIWGLYFLASGIALLNDRRRARRNPDADLSDEEASHLDLSVDEVGAVEPVAASAAPEAPAQLPASRGEQIDDIT